MFIFLYCHQRFLRTRIKRVFFLTTDNSQSIVLRNLCLPYLSGLNLAAAINLIKQQGRGSERGTAIRIGGGGNPEFGFLFPCWLAWYNLLVIFLIFSKNPANTLQCVPTTSTPLILVLSSLGIYKTELNKLTYCGGFEMFPFATSLELYRLPMATRLHVERSGIRIPVGARNCSPKLSGRLRGPRSLLFYAFGVISRLCNGRGVKTTHIHLLPGLKMSGDIPLLPLYTFIAWTGKTLLHFIFTIFQIKCCCIQPFKA
jgi:hypothetical protein